MQCKTCREEATNYKDEFCSVQCETLWEVYHDDYESMEYGTYHSFEPYKGHLGETVVARYRNHGQPDNRWQYHMGTIVERKGRLWIAVTYEQARENRWGYVLPYTGNSEPEMFDDLHTYCPDRTNYVYEMQYMLVEGD